MNGLLKLLPLLATKKKSWVLLTLIAFAGYNLIGGSGSSTGFSLSEIDTLWKEPRDVLVDRVEDVRDVQLETTEEFKSALEKFRSVVNFEGGELEVKFNTLSAALEDSEKAAGNISSKVDKVVTASNRLLEEWREELDAYHDAKLRRRAEQQFDQTRTHAKQLITAMRKAESKTEPVLAAFRDQVLFLKHNLNMQAITALTDETAQIEQDIAALIKDMEASIAEANAFIQSMAEA